MDTNENPMPEEVTGTTPKQPSKPIPESKREDASALLPGGDDWVSVNSSTLCRACSYNGTCSAGCCHTAPRANLTSTNWLEDIPFEWTEWDIVEVSFKNTRKGYFRNVAAVPLEIGEMVVVESNPGYDVGTVSMIGPLVQKQLRRSGIRTEAYPDSIRKIFRKPRPADIEKYEEVKAREHDTMIKARKIAEEMGLNMKIGDVEYQGDGNKAIFYYIADERVDFRQLIRVLADRFKVRIEMRQIGARQEAGRIGGIGPCGRSLCCATWMNNFVSVTTSAARYQDISLNPQKLAGQCAKLKCCLNFEVDTYVESMKEMPDKNIRLETDDSVWYCFKTDVFKKEITYSTDKQIAANLVTIDSQRAFEIIEMNNRGEKPRSLLRDSEAEAAKKKVYNDILEADNVNRFDNKKKKKKRNNRQGAMQIGASKGVRMSPKSKNGENPAKNNNMMPESPSE